MPGYVNDVEENGNFGNKGRVNQIKLQSQSASNMELKAIPDSQSHAQTNEYHHTLALLH